MNKVKKFFKLYGFKGIVFCILYPLIAIITTPVYLVKSLWNCRVLLNGKWQYYAHFEPHLSLTSLFYWIEMVNLERYGVLNKSPIIGLGEFSLSRWFHITYISLYAYCRCGIVTLLIGMFGWLFANMIWAGKVPTLWCFIILFLLLISTSFYLNVFSRQNYNCIGWLFFPIGIYGSMNGDWEIAAIGWLLTGVGSFTVAFISCVVSVAYAMVFCQFEPIVAVIPLLGKICLHFLPNISRGNLNQSISNMIKGIGMTGNVGVRYKRRKNISWSNVYYSVLYLQFFIIAMCSNLEISFFILISLLLFLINLRFRFADEQSMYMLLISSSAAIILSNPYNWIMLGSFWIAISPLPKLAGFIRPESPYLVSVKKPTSVEKLILRANEFLSTVEKGKRIMFAFKEPEYYDDAFDNCYPFIEIFLYVAAKKEVHLFPDWWAVFETNRNGSKNIWGKTSAKIKDNLKTWGSEYVIVCESEKKFIEEKWKCANFEILSKFEWQFFEKEIGIFPINEDKEAIDFWLLKLKEA